MDQVVFHQSQISPQLCAIVIKVIVIKRFQSWRYTQKIYTYLFIHIHIYIYT